MGAPGCLSRLRRERNKNTTANKLSGPSAQVRAQQSTPGGLAQYRLVRCRPLCTRPPLPLPIVCPKSYPALARHHVAVSSSKNGGQENAGRAGSLTGCQSGRKPVASYPNEQRLQQPHASFAGRPGRHVCLSRRRRYCEVVAALLPGKDGTNLFCPQREVRNASDHRAPSGGATSAPCATGTPRTNDKAPAQKRRCPQGLYVN